MTESGRHDSLILVAQGQSIPGTLLQSGEHIHKQACQVCAVEREHARQGIRAVAVPRAPATAPAVKRITELGTRAAAATGRLTSSSPNLGTWPLVPETSPSSKTALKAGQCGLLMPA